jgi:hypothetical protein
MDSRVDDAGPSAALLGLAGFTPGWTDLTAAAERAGGWGRVVMVIGSAATVAAAVLLAAAGRLT